MTRLAIICVLALAIVPAASIGSPGPVRSSACTWQANGQVITEPDGSRHQCHCEKVEAIDEWWCTWVTLETKSKPNRYRLRHQFRNVRYYAHPRLAAWLA